MFFGYSESKNIMSGSSLHTHCCVFKATYQKPRFSAAGVPCVPGYHGQNQDPEYLYEQAKKIGTPSNIHQVILSSLRHRLPGPDKGGSWRRR